MPWIACSRRAHALPSKAYHRKNTSLCGYQHRKWPWNRLEAEHGNSTACCVSPNHQTMAIGTEWQALAAGKRKHGRNEGDIGRGESKERGTLPSISLHVWIRKSRPRLIDLMNFQRLKMLRVSHSIHIERLHSAAVRYFQEALKLHWEHQRSWCLSEICVAL
jgi:hypothetical protein